MKITFFSSQRFERDYLDDNPDILTKIIPGLECKFLPSRLHSATATLAAGADAVCIFVNDDADADVLTTLHNLGIRCLLLRCAGFNQVNLSAASSLGIRVLRVPAYSPYAVAEFAASLLLTVVRKTHKAYNRTRDSNFALNGLIGFDIHGKTIGIIGTGKIGRLFARICLGFGATVIAYDLYPSQEAKDMGVEYVAQVDQLLERSDIVSLHCPLLPSTKHMINKESIEKMKKGVILINTSRGELVNMDALIDGIRSAKIGACGMDVIEGEQALFFEDHSGEILEDARVSTLISFPNVVLTPHVAFCTDTALNNIWTTTINNLAEFSKDKDKKEPFTNEVVQSK